MHEGLNTFWELPRSAASFEANANLHFIIDQARQPEALKQLYSAGSAVEVEYLLQDTEFVSLAETGPIWFSAGQNSELIQLGSRLCQEYGAGLVIQAEDSKRALAHARWLLKVNDGSGGQSLATYYLPELWAAMAIGLAPQAQTQLFGPWSATSSPALRFIGDAPRGWLSWQAPAQDPVRLQSLDAYFSLASSTVPVYRTLRWLYWIDQEHSAFHSPGNAQLPALINNLNTQVEHGIVDGRHLLELADLACGTALIEQPAVMHILRSRARAFEKVEQLQAMTGMSPAS